VDCSAYLSRLELDPAAVGEPSRTSLRTLQHAHVTTVPFENLAIVGDPIEGRPGEGVSLERTHLFEKIVADDRGGFCFELNGLFGWLLDDLGFDATRLAARVLDDDGTARPPANHHTFVVSLDRPYVVDVGLGVPPMRRPLPLDGTPVTDEAGVTWRVVESERADADYLTQVREPDDSAWTDRYIFRDTPRELHFFEATCEFFATAEESTFADGPVVSIATPDGYAKLARDTLTVLADGETTEREIADDEWHGVLERRFGLSL
jgi:N-hydroxyarylamine O-acetyltransferase